jgi:hypothetical protein
MAAMENLFGLPAHPIVIHAAVVLLPLAAIGTIVAAVSPPLRKRFGVLIAIVAVGAAITVWMAQSSGEELEHRVRETDLVEEHTEQGESVLPWALGLAIVAIGVASYDTVLAKRIGDDASKRRLAAGAMAVVALVPAIGGTYAVVKVGHSGAKAVWHDTANERSRSANGDGD